MIFSPMNCIYHEPIKHIGSGYLYYYFKYIHLRVLPPWSILVCFCVHSSVYTCLFEAGLHSMKQQTFMTPVVSFMTFHACSHLTVTQTALPLQVHHLATAVQPDREGGARLGGAAGRDALGLQRA